MFTKKAKRLKRLWRQGKISHAEFIRMSDEDNYIIRNTWGGVA